jgi:hypothetical protein
MPDGATEVTTLRLYADDAASFVAAARERLAGYRGGSADAITRR